MADQNGFRSPASFHQHAMSYDYPIPINWEPPIANSATRRAQQQTLNAKVVQNVPLHGPEHPLVAITMTAEGHSALRRAVEASGLRCQPTCGAIPEVFELGLAPLEREGTIPARHARAYFLRNCGDFDDQFATNDDESIQHAHPLSFDFDTLNLDTVLGYLRVWSIYAGTECVYQLGVITNILGVYDLQLYNSQPSKRPTHTIFYVRHCLWDGVVGKFVQLWEPLVQEQGSIRATSVAAPADASSRFVDTTSVGNAIGLAGPPSSHTASPQEQSLLAGLHGLMLNAQSPSVLTSSKRSGMPQGDPVSYNSLSSAAGATLPTGFSMHSHSSKLTGGVEFIDYTTSKPDGPDPHERPGGWYGSDGVLRPE
ncbi:hypothetical protein CKM354_000002500 [Cercospora kikuchii]|uniref:Uncharacterized protein n=1 Tax=Cercospora kikuchii TaxID=84275 RepID=A0A9P3FB72_9PEZI|nr:uncharacterized protein CKM354_000002500 [Cercospora kikuchii]GIZ36554.1 hypothetical protein CKM354_000002500 [Cercospora kikuchii]